VATAQSTAAAVVVRVFSTSAVAHVSAIVTASAVLKWEGTTPQAEDWTAQSATSKDWTTANPSSKIWTRAA
jgi:hypothetical protein